MMIYRKLWLAVLGLFSMTHACAQQEKDSTVHVGLGKYVGVPLIVEGLIVKCEDTRFRRLRNDYMPEFQRHADDYLQFSPAAVMLALKAAGVESRSSWGRMVTSDVFSAAIMGAVVNTMKHTASVTRPDGSNNHSFPSGHTATAFMTATMLNKEYGHYSPWVGFGAYSVAAGTGLMRMANNKHWLSDVLTGAGIGILSTELGYYFGDLLFRDKGLNYRPSAEKFDRYDNPSFFGLYLGKNIPISGYDIDETMEFSTSSGSTAGVEGAYFLNPYIGLGGRFTASSTRVIVNDNLAEDDTFDALSLSAGAYFSWPLSARWQIGTKLLSGWVHYPSLELAEKVISRRDVMGFGSGISASFRAKKHYGLRFFLDYNLQPSHSASTGEYMNTLTFGSSFTVLF